MSMHVDSDDFNRKEFLFQDTLAARLPEPTGELRQAILRQGEARQRFGERHEFVHAEVGGADGGEAISLDLRREFACPVVVT